MTAEEIEQFKEETRQQVARLFGVPMQILYPLPEEDPDQACHGRSTVTPTVEDAEGYCRCDNPACLFKHS